MKNHWLLGATLLGALSIGVVSVGAQEPDRREIQYTISRNGDAIGTHRVRFERTGSRMTVEHDLSIRVTVLSLEAYRYDLRARETWRDDRLLGFHSTTDRNGESLAVFARGGNSGIRIRRQGAGDATAPSDAIPADPHWNVLSAGQVQMIEAEDGAIKRVRVSEPRDETTTIAGRRVATRRYDVTGDHVATLWYDAQGYLVKKRLRASDGSIVLTEMR